MSQHYTSNTVSVSKWCNKCKRFTQHRVCGHRVGDCLDCIGKLDREHEKRLVDEFREEFEAAKQKELFSL